MNLLNKLTTKKSEIKQKKNSSHNNRNNVINSANYSSCIYGSEL